MSFQGTYTQPIIEADGFSLRPLRRDDAGQIGLYAADARIAKATSSIPHPLPPGTTEGFIERSLSEDRQEDVWVIDPSEDGSQVLGLIGLNRMDREQSEIGYWVAPQLWNNGLASKAVEALVAANPQACRTLFGSVFQDNPASARVLTNAGFEYIGDAETFSVARDATVPTWTYIKKLD
ncbi:GNAT family N-acetyltransferase [Litoreibacter janthinus]|uniref:Protein N-acetyltransferase, RimJ/RimL family n=1 Tax=Litoreibacter janthinus TaxID=670154 RepID=A0A1I6H5Z0_9RHOB|nr:GNAT family N-acetyltransferase [Litoreibacter janthinus]SFR49899.1 Protein N-acetyltransferase, RimJ/RimL family [Litoreibacter janthinus]